MSAGRMRRWRALPRRCGRFSSGLLLGARIKACNTGTTGGHRKSGLLHTVLAPRATVAAHRALPVAPCGPCVNRFAFAFAFASGAAALGGGRAGRGVQRIEPGEEARVA